MRTTLLVALLMSAAFLAVTALAGDASAPAAPNQWVKVDEGRTGERAGSMLVWAPDLKQMLLVGGAKGAPFVQAFDPAAKSWSELSAAAPAKGEVNNYYQTACDPGSRSVYCLSGGTVMYAFSTADKTWKALPAAAELGGLSWQALAGDPAGKRLVVVGSDKTAGDLGWMRTVVYDIPSGKWTRLEVADAKVVEEHKALVAAKEAVIDLGGRVRLAWYRDPKGVGTDEELKSLGERLAALKKLPQMDKFAADADAVGAGLAGKKTLEALKAARALQRRIELAAEEQYPAPCSRRNSPLAFDEQNKVFVLFGGDHEDYLMNDTWVLDLDKKSWKRARPEKAPSPRAGHALAYLPKSGRVALYEGYLQTSSIDYGAIPYTPLNPLQLWLYDAKADRWDLAGNWPLPGKSEATPAPVGYFYGYASERFSPPALAADAEDALVLAGAQTSGIWFWGWKRPAETWTLRADAAKPDAAGREKLGAAPNARLYRTGAFLAEYGEVPDAPKDPGLEKLPENQWVKLPGTPRNPCRGARDRTWGTAVWDSDRDQVLLWGGGHCIRSASSVAHWSPASGRIVEGFDADEPYGANGGGGFDSSVLNRPWVSVHNYNHYAYDPKCKLLVAGRGYLYDPDRMDWLRIEPLALPYRFSWGSTCVEASPHGAVTWSQKKTSDDYGLWLFDRQTGWTDLAPKGKLGGIYCDSHGMVYDSKRDRMIFSGLGGGYSKQSSGQLQVFDFKTKVVDTLTPENLDLGKTGNARELAYVEGADWVLVGELFNKRYTRVYDCEKNKYFLLDAGNVPAGYSVGWMYDSKRKLAYAFTTGGEAWAINVNPKTAKLLEKGE